MLHWYAVQLSDHKVSFRHAPLVVDYMVKSS